MDSALLYSFSIAVALSEVRELVVGKDCPHVKSSSKKPVSCSSDTVIDCLVL